MFSNSSPVSEGFSSNTGFAKESQESASQTTDLLFEEKSSQSTEKSSSEVQTDVFNKQFQPGKYNEKELLSFLNRVCPSVIQELDRVERSKAFINYRPTENESEDEEVKQLHVLSANHLPKLPQLRVSALSWNCAGGTIAVGFETANHDGWCLHESAVYFYNTSKYKFDGSQPSRVVSTSCCVTALAMHPYEPAVIAVGTQGGDIHVWTLSNEGEEIGFTNNTNHSDRVTKLSWVSAGNQLLLVSSSLDSYMYTLKVVTAMQSVTLIDKFVLNEDDQVLKAGVTSFGFAKQSGVFVAALEGGELLHCSIFGALQTGKNVKKPVLKSMGKALGPVTCIEFSPYQDNIFITAHIENKFTIRSLEQAAPLNEIYTDFDIAGGCWSKSQASIVLVWGASNKIIVYNVDNGKKCAELEPEEQPNQPKNKKAIIMTAVVNPKTDTLLALNGSGGDALIWEIPRYFT